MPRWLYFLLVFAALALILNWLHAPAYVLFLTAGLGIVPLAALIGQAVEDIAEHTGDRIGGILFATFGNATELIIGIFALSQGLVDVVRASIIGSILGNALLVLGVAVLVGSMKHGRLRFDARSASQYASLLALCIGGLLLPTVAELLAARQHQTQIVERGIMLSDFIALLLLIGYVASLLFSVFRVGDKQQGEDEDLEVIVGARSREAILRLLAYRRHLAQSKAQPGKSGILRQIDGTLDAIISHETGEPGTTQQSQASTFQQEPAHAKPPLWRGLLLLIAATVGVAILSEILTNSIEPLTEALHWSPAFVGLVFIPLIGGLPEYFNTISMALDKRIDMVLAASAGSSIQIALLMAPILVLISLFMPQRLDLVFSIVELAVLALATFLFSEITKDGELVWLEGLLLILLYAMMGGTVFLFG
jgi:Ca2+:H+ antiporter